MNHGWQSEATGGPKGGWGLLSFSLSFSLFLSLSLSFSLFLSLSLSFPLFLSLSLSFSLFLSLSLTTYLPTDRPTDLSIYLSISLSISLSLSLICLSNYLSIFDPPEPKIIGKTQWFATFLPFRAPGSSFFWDFLFFWSSFFFSSLLWLFPPLLFICPYCRKFDLLNFLRLVTVWCIYVCIWWHLIMSIYIYATSHCAMDQQVMSHVMILTHFSKTNHYSH